ncbi:unnamed protein product [Symbiodinium sp. CCMP2592]|nr:unnamed protein product [Symbiodinium sp. CCMP2592]
MGGQLCSTWCLPSFDTWPQAVTDILGRGRGCDRQLPSKSAVVCVSMLQLMTRATVAAVQRNTSVVAWTAFDLNILDMAAWGDSHAAALGLVNSMDVIFPTAWESHDRTQEMIFFRWNILELLGAWMDFGWRWIDHLPTFTSRLVWQFYCCSLPIRVYILGIHRILWPMLYGGLAKKYEVAEPYRQILVPDTDLPRISTHALVRRVSLLQSLSACDRECFLDLSCAFAALALQAGQRKQEADMYRYLCEVQAMLQSAFCETLHDCMRTHPAAELLRTAGGFLHLIAELPLVNIRQVQLLIDSTEAMRSTEFEQLPIATPQTSNEHPKPVVPSPTDEVEAECIDKKDMSPVSPARILKLYNMLNTVGQVLSKFGVQWFVSHGTLLGAVRHGGQIPHDCDLDLSMFSWDIHKLRNASLMLALQRNGYFMDYLPVQHLITIWRNVRHSEIATRGVRAVNQFNIYTPMLHIFVLFDFQEAGQWQYDTDRLKHAGWQMSQQDLLPLKSHSFGEFLVPVPARPEIYLDKMYGPDWRSTVRSMTALKAYDYYPPTALTSAGPAQPTGPLESVLD